MSDAPSPATYWEHQPDVPDEWAARRALAAAIRGLSERCVRSEATAEQMRDAANAIQQITAGLAPGDGCFDRFKDGRYGASPAEHIDRTALTGACNPVAPPLKIAWDGTVARCPLTFTEVHQGAPGMAHGGWISSVLDQVCGNVMVMSHLRGFTGKLTVRYLKPTPLHQPLVCAGWVEDRSGRTVTVKFDMRFGDAILVKGEALMIEMDLARAQQVIREAPKSA